MLLTLNRPRPYFHARLEAMAMSGHARGACRIIATPTRPPPVSGVTFVMQQQAPPVKSRKAILRESLLRGGQFTTWHNEVLDIEKLPPLNSPPNWLFPKRASAISPWADAASGGRL